MLPDSTGFDQVKAIIGRKRDSEPEKFCSLIQVINEDCFDFGRVVAHGSAVRLTLRRSCFMSFEIETLQNKQSLLKRMIRHTLLLTLVLMAGMVITGTSFAACGSLTMAEMNWASAQLMAQVDKIILEKGYGCEVELVSGATMPTFASMNEKGKPDVAAEQWANAVRDPLAKAVSEGRLHIANESPITGLGEGWWIPPHTAKKHPQLKTALDIMERPDLFPDKEDPSKGAFVGCPAGWGCQLANANLFRAFEMEKKGWVLVDPGSAAGLDGSMAKAVERGENWFGYYWSPTSLIGKYNMVPVDFGVPFAGSANWDGCIVKPEQECASLQIVSKRQVDLRLTTLASEFIQVLL